MHKNKVIVSLFSPLRNESGLFETEEKEQRKKSFPVWQINPSGAL